MILAFIGTTEVLLIAALALLLFGGNKLPELMRGLGRGVKEFKEGIKEVPEEVNALTYETTDKSSKEDK
ncbi:MAG: twin-arginine translocase TatA/TatE family subunit [Muribaculaceae bacterium]|nr:twin-arginine translocase TatA/TatE family subunit [Muribaculaceae bacterium]